MPGHYHAIVWIDHREARVFHFNVSEVDRLVLHPQNPTRHIHHKANSIGSGHRYGQPHQTIAAMRRHFSQWSAALARRSLV